MSISSGPWVVGAVTNGGARDFPAWSQRISMLPATSRSRMPMLTSSRSEPVEIDGLKIRSGDLLHGDLHGVQSIPRDIATQIPAAARPSREGTALMALCQSPEFSLEKLRAAVSSGRTR